MRIVELILGGADVWLDEDEHTRGFGNSYGYGYGSGYGFGDCNGFGNGTGDGHGYDSSKHKEVYRWRFPR